MVWVGSGPQDPFAYSPALITLPLAIDIDIEYFLYILGQVWCV